MRLLLTILALSLPLLVTAGAMVAQPPTLQEQPAADVPNATMPPQDVRETAGAEQHSCEPDAQRNGMC